MSCNLLWSQCSSTETNSSWITVDSVHVLRWYYPTQKIPHRSNPLKKKKGKKSRQARQSNFAAAWLSNTSVCCARGRGIIITDSYMRVKLPIKFIFLRARNAFTKVWHLFLSMLCLSVVCHCQKCSYTHTHTHTHLHPNDMLSFLQQRLQCMPGI